MYACTHKHTSYKHRSQTRRRCHDMRNYFLVAYLLGPVGFRGLPRPPSQTPPGKPLESLRARWDTKEDEDAQWGEYRVGADANGEEHYDVCLAAVHSYLKVAGLHLRNTDPNCSVFVVNFGRLGLLELVGGQGRRSGRIHVPSYCICTWASRPTVSHYTHAHIHIYICMSM